jgi:tRNA-intron lyase
MSATKLTSPRPKRPSRRRDEKEAVLQQPFPVPIASLNDVKANNSIWRWYGARYDAEDNVAVVEDGDEAEKLAEMGFFGEWDKEEDKFAFVVLDDVEPEIVTREELQLKRGEEEEEQQHAGMVVEEVRVSNDRDPDEVVVRRALRLDPCEAFFLSYALGCLLVTNDGKALDLDSMWELFRASDADFSRLYRVYHHFRSKGWVVRRGVKFGADFLLYKHGPPFYHASYSVKVDGQKGLTVNLAADYMAGLNRVTETAAKELILARVGSVQDEAEDDGTIECMKKMSVRETLVKRWNPSLRIVDKEPINK